MNFFRVIFYWLYHRRRLKHQFFLFIFLILIISIFTCYWWIEIYSNDNHIEIFEKKIRNFENDELGKKHPIYLKYIQNPYYINIWNIINEANRKYQDNNNNNKYLVYSCRFMCGGKNSIFFFK